MTEPVSYRHTFGMVYVSMYDHSSSEENDTFSIFIDDMIRDDLREFYKSFFKLPVEYNLNINYGKHEFLRDEEEYNICYYEYSIESILQLENCENNRLKILDYDLYLRLQKFEDTFLKKFVHIY